MGGGTEFFSDIGNHCEDEDCHQLDFLPFKCDGCNKWFCLEHRSYADHNCPKAYQNSRVVAVCEVCSASIEKKAGETNEEVLGRHARSGNCDAAKKAKPRCPVKRCKELLTFSNAATCKDCRVEVCLKHRFPSDHACKKELASSSSSAAVHPLLARLSRELQACAVDVKENKGKVNTKPQIVRAF